MMDRLYKEIKQTIETIMQSYGLCDYRIGMVISTKPLQIKINDRIILQRDQIVLTSAVVHKSIDYAHTHSVTGIVDSVPNHAHGNEPAAGGHNHTLTVESQTGLSHPIVIVDGLTIGDKVIMISADRGQKYIVLSKVVD